MKGIILILLGIIVAVLVIGGVMAYSFMSEHGVSMDELGSKIKEKMGVSQSSGDSSSGLSEGIDIVSEEIKANGQQGEGFYREVTYSDGGFRQYDKDSGELIGSSYESDQDKLPNLG